ncbi:MAG: sigma-70 family RNA polymerase sigma factor [Candidatus Omnitrophota bacterium]|jgi:RNA polymerase sigma-70 factor (ECF subfamily)
MEKPNNEDSLFIERFLGGETGGFEELVRKYQDRVLNIVYSLIGKDRECEDIAQEVFLKVYHNLGSFRQRSQFSTWLYRIAVNATYDFLRRRRNFLDEEVSPENIAAGSDGPREALSKREKEAALKTALAAVPLEYRTALVLKDIEGLSYAQIAQVLGCRMGTVESRIYRARQILKEKLLKGREEAA